MRLISISLTDRKLIKKVKDEVENLGKLNKGKKISQLDGTVIIYTLIDPDDPQLQTLLESIITKFPGQKIGTEVYNWEYADTNLETLVEQFCLQEGVDFQPFMPVVPKKWSVYEPLLLFGPNTFEHPQWDQLHKQKLMEFLIKAKFPKITHIAVNKPIDKADVMRRPTNLVPIYGDFGDVSERARVSPTQEDFDKSFWCSTTQNGIRQTWNPMYTMFSRGNITEKARILNQFPNLHGKFAVDLYGGIGYFTLSYLKNGAKVLCWEINPWSIEALIRNCRLNNFKYRLIKSTDSAIVTAESCDADVYIFHESNEEAMRRIRGNFPVTHINLGLLPSSEQSWSITQEILKQSTDTTIVHVHENVHVNQIEAFAESLTKIFGGRVTDIITVKTFAPDIWHIVVDITV